MAFFAAIIQAAKQKKDEMVQGLNDAGDSLLAQSGTSPSYDNGASSTTAGVQDPSKVGNQQQGSFMDKLKERFGVTTNGVPNYQSYEPERGTPSPYRNLGGSLQAPMPAPSTQQQPIGPNQGSTPTLPTQQMPAQQSPMPLEDPLKKRFGPMQQQQAAPIAEKILGVG